MRNFFVVIFESLNVFLLSLPRFRFLNPLKLFLLRLDGAQFGCRLDIYPGVYIMPGRNLLVGNDVVLSPGVLITTSGGLSIGDRSMIGYRSQILTTNHTVPDGSLPISRSGDLPGRVHIGSDVWIGAGCIISPGVKIGNGTVVAAGSVVTQDLDSYSFYIGNPARLLKRRN